MVLQRTRLVRIRQLYGLEDQLADRSVEELTAATTRSHQRRVTRRHLPRRGQGVTVPAATLSFRGR